MKWITKDFIAMMIAALVTVAFAVWASTTPSPEMFMLTIIVYFLVRTDVLKLLNKSYGDRDDKRFK